MKKINILHNLAGTILVSGLIVSLSVLAYFAIAQTTASTETNSNSTIQGITFPVEELGNCSDEKDCRAYCDKSDNMLSCIAFAKDHGLMNQKDVKRAQEFAQALQSGGGPGGCTSPNQCEELCSNLNNLETCVAFAEKNGIKDEHFDQAKKILKHIQSGGQTPGGCNSKDECQNYCGEFSHAQECFDFAKAAGITQIKGAVNVSNSEQNPTLDQLQKLSELAKTGETPGGCTSKDTCEEYCKNQAHRDECVAFGVKAGFIKPEEADMIKKSGGNGPGGCNSSDSCQSYCNNPAHQEECFKFAEEHGFSNHEETRRTKDGFVRLRAGLEQAPPEIAECLKSTVGPNVLDNIQSGKLVPGPEVGQSVRSCFEKFGKRGDASEPFKHAPPEVTNCLKEKVGDKFDDIKSGKTMPSPEIADTFRVCFQQVQFQNGFEGQSGPNGPKGEQGNSGEGQHGPGAFGGTPPADAVRHFVETAPPGIRECLEKSGIDPNKLKTGESTIDPSVLKSCFNDFHPTQPPTLENQNFNKGICPAMPTVNECPSGQIKVVAYSSPDCGTYYRCQPADKATGEVFPPIDTTHGCPSSQYWNGTSCVTGNYSTDPATGCAQAGGTWDATTHFCKMPGTNPPPPVGTTCPSGQYMDPATRACVSSITTTPPSPTPSPTLTPPPTTDPATECVKHGGTWSGSTCIFPTPPPPPPIIFIPRSSSDLASILDALQSILLQMDELLSRFK